MALCDRLEASQAERERRRQMLHSASVHQVTRADRPGGLRKSSRFYLSHLAAMCRRVEDMQLVRRTLLDLAIRGHLVAQHPEDEPASKQLAYIESQRARLVKEKLIPKPNPLPTLDDTDAPSWLKPGWEWTRLGKLCYRVADGPHHSPSYVSSDEGIPFLSTRNVRPAGFDLSDVKYISRSDYETFSRRIKPERDDIIYTKGGTTGIARVNDLDFEFAVWVHLAVLRIEKERLSPAYVAMVLNSPFCYEQSQSLTQGTSNFDLGLTRMIKILLPLPPFAEQERIVRRVTGLFELCDRLETHLATAQIESARLLEAVLHQALEQASHGTVGERASDSVLAN